MKVKELIEKCDTSKTDYWDFSIYDIAGMRQFAYINSIHPITDVPEAILDCEVKSYTLGYNSLYIKIEPVVEAEYQSEEICLSDGYEKVFPVNPIYKRLDALEYYLYAKKGKNSYSFAKITGFN